MKTYQCVRMLFLCNIQSGLPVLTFLIRTASGKINLYACISLQFSLTVIRNLHINDFFPICPSPQSTGCSAFSSAMSRIQDNHQILCLYIFLRKYTQCSIPAQQKSTSVSFSIHSCFFLFPFPLKTTSVTKPQYMWY